MFVFLVWHCLYLRVQYALLLLLLFFFCVGESGLGKSTLIQSLFLTNFFGNKTSPPAIGKYILCCVHIYVMLKAHLYVTV